MTTNAGQASGSVSLPTGTVTFLFSDIEGSTQRWERYREAMATALQRHDELMQDAIARRGGFTFKTIGDAFCSAFTLATDAIAAALAAQRALAVEDFSAVEGLRVRMAAHTGHAEARDGDYFGPAVNRVARLLAIGHGGQVLVSGTTTDLVQDEMPPQSSLRDLGEHRLKDLGRSERVYQLIADGLPIDFPSLRSLDVLRGNLPVQLTSFIGRESQVADISGLLAVTRLVTLIGAGGVGKTRTVVQVAAELATAYSDGTWFIDLAPITEPSLVASALASVFDVGESGASRPLIDEVALTLRNWTALLIFDNCEQIVGAAADAADHILRRCPKIAILATSREPLVIDGEETYRMPSLSVPPAHESISAEEALRYEAVALFVARATSAQKSFALTDTNTPFVTDIVRRLDGIALAIELAAPRVRAFSVGELARRLDERFQLLTSESRRALPRHKTLGALIDWSYELLNEPEQRLFRRLSIFRGTFALDAAQAVCTDDGGDREEVVPLMSALVDKSLVTTELRDDDQRYRMLESTRQYGLERLTGARESDAVAGRHCRYFVALAERASDEAYETPSDLWIARHRADLENYRAAIDWGLSQGNDTHAGAAIVADLRRFWFESFPSEGRVLLARAMAAVDAETEPKVRGSLVLAAARIDDGSRNVQAQDLARAAAAFADANERLRQIDALTLVAFSLTRSGRLAEALTRFQEALALARALPHARLIATVLVGMSTCLNNSGDPKRAKSALGEVMTIYRREDDRHGIAQALWNLGEICFAEGDIDAALENAREAIAIGRALNHERFLVSILHNAAAYLLARGDVREATQCARESLTIAVRRESFLLGAFAIEDLAQIGARCGDVNRAARLIGYANSIDAHQAVPREFTEQFGYDRTMLTLRAALSEETITALMAEGAALDENRAVSEAMAISSTPP